MGWLGDGRTVPAEVGEGDSRVGELPGDLSDLLKLGGLRPCTLALRSSLDGRLEVLERLEDAKELAARGQGRLERIPALRLEVPSSPLAKVVEGNDPREVLNEAVKLWQSAGKRAAQGAVKSTFSQSDAGSLRT